MTTAKKNFILHAHIFKNAGSTIDWILNNNFKKEFRDDRNDQIISKDPANYLKQTLAENNQLLALSSHSLPLPEVVIPGYCFHTIVMLRNPILRVRSVYDFEHKQGGATPGAIHAKKYNFRDYVQWRMREDVAPTIRNMQTRYLTHNSLPVVRGLVTNEHLERALHYVKNNPLVGLVEKFDQSMGLFKAELNRYFDDFDVTYQIQNITQKIKKSEEEKILDLQKDLGEELYLKLIQENEFDITLYEKSNEIISNRLLSVS